MIIDFHTHVFPADIRDNPGRYLDKDTCFAQLYSQEKPRIATAGDLIASMDAAGVDLSVIAGIAWSSRELCFETNDYIMESAARYRGRLIGLGSVQPFADWAPEEVERCARGGIRGIGELRPDESWLDASNSEAMARFTNALKKHGLILLLHSTEPVGHSYPGKGDSTPAVLSRFIEHYPGLKIVLAHWGGGLPFYALMPEVKAALGNVWFDSAASPFLYADDVYRRVASLAGEDRILFGSDYPLISQGRAIDEVNSLGLPETVKTLFLGGNAMKLLGV